jgi:prepilin-type N-terminal cleavage/methylation domain-containing protein
MRLINSKLKFRRAFTLIEMVVVIVLISIVAAAIIPEMKGSFNDALLRSTGRDLVNVFSFASSRAVGLGQCYRVRFDTPNGRYAVERQIHDGTGTDFVPLKDVSGAEGRLDSRIAFAIIPPEEPSSGNDLSPGPADQSLPDAISFYPDGTSDAAEIRLRDPDGFQLLLQLNPVTGRVHITERTHE